MILAVPGATVLIVAVVAVGPPFAVVGAVMHFALGTKNPETMFSGTRDDRTILVA